MECPHLEESVKIVEPVCINQNSPYLWTCSELNAHCCTSSPLKTLTVNILEVILAFIHCQVRLHSLLLSFWAVQLTCEERVKLYIALNQGKYASKFKTICQTEKNPWICLHCGIINCGRYVNAHAKDHYEKLSSSESSENTESQCHSVCMDCDSTAVFCYRCDEFVMNDTLTGQLDLIRQRLNALTNAHQESQLKEIQEIQENQLKELQENQLKEKEEEQKEKENYEQRKENCETSNDKTRRRKNSETDGTSKKKQKIDNGTKVKPKTSGLRNLGNTCFMNAVLQSLSNIHSFCGYIKQLPSLENKVAMKKKVHQTRQHSSKEGDNVFVVEELRKTLVSLWGGSKGAISPEALFSVIWKVVPRFRGYQQQDAHEFMRYLLDRLHTELLTLLPYPNSNSAYIGPKNKSTIVTAIFGGILQSEVNCLICGTESKKHDPFLDLSLDIPTHFTAKTAKPKEGETVCHISDCLQSFTEIEELEESELYFCYNCKQKQRSTKRFWIRRLPNVLCLHLKRFRWSTFFRCKVDTYVDFPLRGLDMNNFMLDNMHGTRNSCAGTNEYDLAAVIVHHGSGAGSGHYTAYAIHEGRWYHFNDSTVSACEEETVSRCKAYILFYVRRELKLPDFFNNIQS